MKLQMKYSLNPTFRYSFLSLTFSSQQLLFKFLCFCFPQLLHLKCKTLTAHLAKNKLSKLLQTVVEIICLRFVIEFKTKICCKIIFAEMISKKHEN